MEDKTYIEDINRNFYDFRNEDTDSYKVEEGLTPAIVAKISDEKNDPEWMREFRLKALVTYNRLKMAQWGPPIDGLDMDNIVTYVRPNTKMTAKWSDVPDEIKDTFERLGIPEAERTSLAGVGAQYDSELVYHNVKEEVAAQGVVYAGIEDSLRGPYADMIRSHFMKLVTPSDHKFAALHGAVEHLHGHSRHAHRGRQRAGGPGRGELPRDTSLRRAAEEHRLPGGGRLHPLAPHPQEGLHPHLLRHPSQMGG